MSDLDYVLAALTLWFAWGLLSAADVLLKSRIVDSASRADCIGESFDDAGGDRTSQECARLAVSASAEAGQEGVPIGEVQSWAVSDSGAGRRRVAGPVSEGQQ